MFQFNHMSVCKFYILSSTELRIIFVHIFLRFLKLNPCTCTMQVHDIEYISGDTLNKIRFTYLENSQPVSIEDLGMSNYPSPQTGLSPCISDTQDGGVQHSTDWAAYMDACIATLIKEVKEK